MSTSLLNQLLDNISGHIYWKDITGKYLGCNKVFAEMLGLKNRHDIVGKTDFDFLDKKRATAIQRNDLEVIHTKQEVIFEEHAIDSHGEVAYYLTHKVPLRDDHSDEIIGVIGITLNISEQKRTEQALFIAKEKAEAADKAKLEFIRNMEHDIRTPFSGIYSITQTLATSEPDPKRKEHLEIVSESAEQLLTYCNDIIQFVKSEAGSPIIKEKFNLSTLIDNIFSMEKAPAYSKGLRLEKELDPNLPFHITSDPHRLQQLLINLISNAIKFTPSGYVKVSARNAKQLSDTSFLLQLIIEDTGIGIPADKQEIIYEKFTRLTPANQGIYKGSGLGLTIVKKIITELNGTISVSANPGHGTCFTCCFPVEIADV